MNRFDLEENMSRMLDTANEIDDIIYKYSDSPDQPSQDQMLNMLIGVKELLEARYDRMWNTFEQLIKTGVIASEQSDEKTHTV